MCFGHITAFARTYSVEVETGLGYDSNVFRSPDASYFDPFSKTTINPIVQSGLFVPYGLKAEYNKTLRKHPGLRKLKFNRWISEFKLNGRKYLNSDFDNADEHRIAFNTGLEFLLKKAGRKKNTFYIGPLITQKKKTYFDRDMGLEKLTATGESLGNRFSYLAYGLETKLSIRTTLIQYAITAETRTYDYEATAFDEFDHLYYRVGAKASYQIISPTKLTVGYDYFVRDYDKWVARDLNGSKKTTLNNPLREYTYHEFYIYLRNRLSPLWVVYLDYSYKIRNDEFLGYSDYTRNRYQVRAIYHDKRQRRLRASLAYWTRNHPNTFAFDMPTVNGQPSPKTDYDVFKIKLSGEMPLYREWFFWGEIKSIQQDTTDPRYKYDRNQIIAGVKVAF